jgi:thiopurine S-methyltransferase
VSEDWLSRWEQGRTGWHEANGSASLRQHWPQLPCVERVLVPLCGKTKDLIWLEARGLSVIGIELSRIAVEAFFAENRLSYSVIPDGALKQYRCNERDISIYYGDYFAFDGTPCDALFDRGALVALPANRRMAYARRTDGLLRADATRLVVTLEYDQARADGPPYSVESSEIDTLWPGLVRVSAIDDLQNAPPKFRDAGLERVVEVVWLSGNVVSASVSADRVPD